MTFIPKRMPRAVTTITPQRISFVGGGTDLPAYYSEHEGGVISSAIDQYVYVTVKRHSPLFQEQYRLSYSKTEHANSLDDIENSIARECLRLVPIDTPLYIATAADLPASSGLGSSSSFAVGLLNALHLMRVSAYLRASWQRKHARWRSDAWATPSASRTSMLLRLGALTILCSKRMDGWKSTIWCCRTT